MLAIPDFVKEESSPSGLHSFSASPALACGSRSRGRYPFLAEVLGARPPRKVPAWLARFLIGEGGVSMMTKIRGGANGLFGEKAGGKDRKPPAGLPTAPPLTALIFGITAACRLAR